MKTTVDDAPFDDDDDDQASSSLRSIATRENKDDVDPLSGQVRLRTRIVVSVLSSLVVLSYVVSGAGKVFMKFLKTVTNTSSMKTSFEAAADEVIRNEDKLITRVVTKKKSKGNQQSTKIGRINGE